MNSNDSRSSLAVNTIAPPTIHDNLLSLPKPPLLLLPLTLEHIGPLPPRLVRPRRPRTFRDGMLGRVLAIDADAFVFFAEEAALKAVAVEQEAF